MLFYAYVLCPAILPLITSCVWFYAAQSAPKRLWQICIAIGAYATSLPVTNQAYHVRNAYDALPEIHDFLAIGLGWAFICALPGIAALFFKNATFSEALAKGGLIGLGGLLLVPPNFGMIVILSFE